MDARLCDEDWKCAFEYFGEQNTRNYGTPDVRAVPSHPETPTDTFTRSDVAEVLAIADGENGDADWIGVFRLRDGRFAYVEAGCDHTGWDCIADGFAVVGPDLASIVITLDPGARDRLGAQLGLA